MKKDKVKEGGKAEKKSKKEKKKGLQLRIYRVTEDLGFALSGEPLCSIAYW